MLSSQHQKYQTYVTLTLDPDIVNVNSLGENSSRHTGMIGTPMSSKPRRVRSKIFKEKLHFLLKRERLKPADLIKQVGAGTNVVYSWYNDGVMPTLDQALQIARVLRCTLEYLADDESEALPTPTGMTEEYDRVWEHVMRLGVDEAERRLDRRYEDLGERGKGYDLPRLSRED